MNHVLTIDKQSVIDNINTCKGNKDVCLMVKANTYGLGDTAVTMLIDLGYQFFGVSTLEEALKLRSFSDQIKILLVSYISLDEIETCIDNDITFTVYDFMMVDKLRSNACFHLKFDTNMGRLGFQLDEIDKLIFELKSKQLKPEGIFSHLACASNVEKTLVAIKNFKYCIAKFDEFDLKYIHLLNSYGSLNYNTEFDNLVRVGIGIWGYLANEEEATRSKINLQPALSLKLSISHVKQYEGEISYDHLDKVRGTILTIPFGYHDGLRRDMRHYEYKEGTIVGNINMCQHMVLTKSNDYNRGDMITLFDKQDLYKVCKYSNITSYEFLVNLSSRIKREVI